MANVFQEESRGLIAGRISSTFIHPLQLGQASLLLFVMHYINLSIVLGYLYIGRWLLA